MTHLCVPIFVTDLIQARTAIAQAVVDGADIVELRIDKLQDESIIAELLRENILPAIVTCRAKWEGGFSTLDDSARAALLARASANGAMGIDLELKAASHLPALKHPKSKLILSAHDFTARPADLRKIIDQMNGLPADVNKIAWHAKSIRENIEALKILRDSPRPTIALCMGEAGLLSRVLAKKFGAFLTFASLDAQSATAPGQISLGDMKDLYRWDAIGADTRVYGVVANPVHHSMSPAIHNAAFTATGHDGIYLPMLVDPEYESFRAFLQDFLDFRELDLCGFSITIPHKENALRFLREAGADIEELALRIGAVNTIVIDRSAGIPKLTGKNTDYAAILDSIAETLGIARTGFANLRVSILGAGGTGRTAVAALANYGAHILIQNRTLDRAQALADEFNGRSGTVIAVSMEQLRAEPCDVLINTTSIGMSPHVNQNPFGDAKPPITEKTLVFEAVYNPMKTRLLTIAEQLGARTISGVEMFLRQAATQFEAWTGTPAPQKVMREVIIGRLS